MSGSKAADHPKSTTRATPDDEVRRVVERYYAVVADLDSTADDLAALLDKKVTIREHPNPITPDGVTRGKQETLAALEAGKGLLSAQSFDVHEIVVNGERAAVRAVWRGTIAQDAGRLRAGSELVAQVAAFLTVRGGKIVEHETFDCYPPFG